ncbi:MAG: hypothetical protein AB1643_01100 [Patescibacteria group bacterium]
MKFKNQNNYKEGQAIITTVVFLIFVLIIIVASFSFSVLKGAKISRNSLDSKKSYFLAEAGVEDVSYRMIKGKLYSNMEVLILDGHYATTTVIVGFGNEKEVVAEADVDKAIRKTKTTLTTDAGTSFFYGVQVDDGGLVMENNSTVTGNIYSNGPVNGANSNLTKGSVVSAGPSGLINGINATSSAYAHTISNSTIDGDAYYQIISNTTVNGQIFPGSPDQPSSELPITDEMITDWENAATVSVISSPCPYIINSDTLLGPVKINCNLTIQGDPTITLTGMVWVVGNITIENTAIIRLDSSLLDKSIAIIADNPANRLTSSKINLQNSVQFQGSGTEGSYILLVSQNNSAENGGSEAAINVQNSVSGKLLVYAAHGEIQLQNSVNLKEVTGYKIRLKNTANIIYETGLASLLFETGPGGGYNLIDWEEI